MCIFIGCWPDLLKDTHTDGVKSTSDHVSRLVLLFSCPENPSINHLNFYWIKQIDYIFPCVSQRVKNNSHATVATRLRLVSYFLFFTRCDICDLLQYTGMGKNVIYLLNNYFSNIVFCNYFALSYLISCFFIQSMSSTS